MARVGWGHRGPRDTDLAGCLNAWGFCASLFPGGLAWRAAGGSPHRGAHSLGADVHMKGPGWSSADWRGEGAHTEPPRCSLGQDAEWWVRGAGRAGVWERAEGTSQSPVLVQALRRDSG